jgi:hypothetical protein
MRAKGSVRSVGQITLAQIRVCWDAGRERQAALASMASMQLAAFLGHLRRSRHPNQWREKVPHKNAGERLPTVESRVVRWVRTRPGLGIAALGAATCGFVAVVPASAGPLGVSVGLVGVLVGMRRSR